MPRAARVCRDPRCGEITAGTYCDTHAREHELARGRRQARGYDRDYDRATRRATGSATHCVSCGQPFTKANPATGGHRRAIRNGGLASDGIDAQCRRCNYGWRRTGL